MIKQLRNGLIVSFIFLSSALMFLQEEALADVRNDVIATAEKFKGTPYRWAGTTPSGFDCSGYIGYVFRQVGIDLPRTTSGMYGVGKSVSKSDLQKGDLVFFNTSGKGVSHAGIYIGSDKFIHASTSKGVIVSSLNDPYYWGSRYIGAKRVIQEEKKAEQAKAEKVEEAPKPLPAGSYHDVPKQHWAHNEIKRLAEENVVNGYPGDLFKPEKEITRAEAAQIIVNRLGLTSSGKRQRYSDVPDHHWASEAIAAATEAGILKGYDENTFKPNETIKRSEVAAILNRAYQLEQMMTTESVMTSFADIDKNHWAYDDVSALVAHGITTGYEDETFRPEKGTKRAEFVAFLYRSGS